MELNERLLFAVRVKSPTVSESLTPVTPIFERSAPPPKSERFSGKVQSIHRAQAKPSVLRCSR